jgi:hypothetical protein
MKQAWLDGIRSDLELLDLPAKLGGGLHQLRCLLPINNLHRTILSPPRPARISEEISCPKKQAA